MIFIYFIIFLVAIAAALGIVYCTYYNTLQSKKLKVNEAESVIDESLRNKYDLLLRSTSIVKSNCEIKAEYFKEYEDLKNKKLSNFDLDRKLTEGVNLLYKLKNDFPELDSNRNLKDSLMEIKRSDERLEAAKSYYNKYTTELNLIIRKFPSNIISRIHNFEINPFFDGKNLDDDIIKDMKL